jgi:outer membrane protein
MKRPPCCFLLLLLAPVMVSVRLHGQVVDPASGVPAFTLQDALTYAAEHYPSLRAAVQQVNASSANVNVAKTAYLPRFDAVWQTNRATANNIFGALLPQSIVPAISGPVLPETSSQSVWGNAAGGLLSWEPVDFGLRGAVVREAQADVSRARAGASVTRLAVQQAVGLAFLEVLGAQQAVTASNADVERREVLARAAHTLVDNQLRAGVEASRADAELAAARTRRAQAKQILIAAEAALGRVLGVEAGRATVRASSLLEVVPPPTPSASSATPHPAVQAGQAAVDLARAREGVLARTDLPRLYLQSSVFARGSGANPDGAFDTGFDGFGFDRANWAAGVQIVVPNLFGFASLRARRAAASSLREAESARYDEAVLAVRSQQQAADALVEAAREIAGYAPPQLTAARQTELQARARYDAGLAGIVEVAEAQNLLAGAEYQQAIARVNVWRALFTQAVSYGSLTTFLDLLRAAGPQEAQ